MTRDEAVTMVMDRLGNRTGLETKIIAEMKLAQTQLEKSAALSPWFLQSFLTGSMTVGTAVGEASLALGDTTLRLCLELGYWVKDADGDKHPVELKDYEALVRATTEGVLNESGLPEFIALQKQNLFWFPYPDAIYNYRLGIYVADTVLSTNVENEWLKHAPDVLINKAGMAVAKFLRDPAALGLFKEELGEALARLDIDNIAHGPAGSATSLSLGG